MQSTAGATTDTSQHSPAAPLLNRLEQALSEFDGPGARRACDELVRTLHEADDHPDPAQAARAVNAVRRARRPELVQQLAEALLQLAWPAPWLVRQYAQSLVDQGIYLAGLAVLRDLLEAGAEPDPVDEALEARGLAGRIYKQMFLLTGTGAPRRRARLLAEAVAHYQAGYESSTTQLWQGGNVVALLARAAREGIEVPGVPDSAAAAARTAVEVLRVIDSRPQLSAWDCATALEAELALRHPDAALARLRGFLDNPDLDAFEVGSLLRQLTELWELRPDQGIGVLIIPPLQSVLLRKRGAELDVVGTDVSAASGRELLRRDAFEAVFGADGFETQRWFENLLERCRGVVRIEDLEGEGVGSGFLLAGQDLSAALPARVVMTNAHVIPEVVAAEEAVVAFRGLPHPATTRVRRVVWSSPSGQLDATILELEDVPFAAAPCPLARQMPALKRKIPARVYVMGHPLGAPKVKVSIRDNTLLDYDDDRLHYLAATEHGSSGGPVFDRHWNAVGLHHAGSASMPRLHGTGSYPANEGMRLDRIRSALA